GQIRCAPAFDFTRRYAAQYAGVANILGNAQIGVESKALGEIAALCTHFARRHSEDVRDSGTRFHHAGQNLESRRFSCSVWSDQSKDFALANLKCDSADCFHEPILFVKILDMDGRARAFEVPHIESGAGHFFEPVAGQMSPDVRISASDGIP